MSKRNRKRLLSVLLTAALIFTLALSSVMAQDEEHVRADKLSVGAEAVEDEEATEGLPDEEVGEISEDEATEEETVSTDKIRVEGSSEEDAAEADADAAEPVEVGSDDDIRTLAAEDMEDEDYGIQTLATGTEANPNEVSNASEMNEVLGSYRDGTHDVYIRLTDDISGTYFRIGSSDETGTPVTDGHFNTVYIDLNGHTITGPKSGSDVNQAVVFYCHSSLVLSNGTIAGYGGDESEYALITVCSQCRDTAIDPDTGIGYAVILDNVTLKDNHSTASGTGNGGGISVRSGSYDQRIELKNGTTITNCSGRSGGGIYNNGATVDIIDGTITDCCTTSGNGGGIYNGNRYGDSVVNLYNATITGNSAEGDGSGIYMSAGGALNVYSEAFVSGNDTSNVYLVESDDADDALITIGEELSGSAQVGVTTETKPEQEAPVQFTTAEEDTDYYASSASYFFSDEEYKIRENAEGKYLELYLMDFEEEYLTGEDGNLYTSATANNYSQILAGESDWEALSEDEQEEINAHLTSANGGSTLTYPMLLDQAKALRSAADGFEEKYLTGEDGELYIEATEDNYEQILSGAVDWDALSADVQAIINADLTAANGGEELTYPMLLEQAQALADAAAANEFEEKYLTGEDGELYIEATEDNYNQILSGAADWNALTPEAQAIVNADLTAANGGEELTYPMLLDKAQAIADALAANEFEEKYLTGEDGNLYIEATADNYEQILSGAADWDALTPEAQAIVNADLTAAWQAAGHDGELTYPMLLQWAKDLAAQLESTGAVKTGDNSRLYLYLLLLAAAGAAASAAVAVSRRRV